jgi:hypothetical protein
VILMSVALGWFFSYTLGEDWETYFYIMSIMFLQSLCLIGSLLAVRSCGYRLVGHQAITDTATGNCSVTILWPTESSSSTSVPRVTWSHTN